ncbi:MAG: translocation/assembly module TamB domain-containing protein [Planctomycetota bacterium]
MSRRRTKGAPPAQAKAQVPVKRGWMRRAVRALLVLVMVTATLLAVVYIFRWRLFGGIIKGKVERELGRVVQGTVTIDSMSGSLIGSIEFRTVNIQPLAISQLAEPAAADRIRIEYSLWGILTGSDTPLRKVEVQGVRCAVKAFDAPSAEAGALEWETIRRGLDQVLSLPAMDLVGVSARYGRYAAYDVSAHVVSSRSRGSREALLDLAGRGLDLSGIDAGDVDAHLVLRRDAAGIYRVSGDVQAEKGVAEIKAELDIPVPGQPGAENGFARGTVRVRNVSLLWSMFTLPGELRELQSVWREALVEFNLTGGGLANAAGGATVTLMRSAGASDTLSFAVKDHVVALAPVTIALPFGRLELGGASGLLRGGAAVAGGPADGLHAVLTADVNDLRAMMPAGLAALSPEGRVVVRAELRGDLARPEPVVRATVTGGALALPAPLTPLREGAVEAVLAGGEFTIETVRGRLGDKEFSGSARVGLKAPYALSGNLKAAGLPVVRSADGGLQVRLDADIRLAGTMEEMKLAGSLNLPELLYNGVMIDPGVQADIEVMLKGPGGTATGAMRIKDLGVFKAAVPLPEPLHDLWSRWREAAVAFRIREFRPATMTGNATITLTGNEASGAAGVDTLEITCRDGAVALVPVTIATPFGRLELGGDIALRPAEAGPGRSSRGLQAVFTTEMADLLRKAPPRVAAMHPAGTVVVRAGLGGGLIQPEPVVRITVTGGMLDLPAPLSALREGAVEAVLAGGEFAIETVKGRLGDREFSGSARVGLKAPYALSGGLKGAGLPVVRSADGSLQVRLDADIRLTGTMEEMKLAGALGIPELQYNGATIDPGVQADIEVVWKGPAGTATGGVRIKDIGVFGAVVPLPGPLHDLWAWWREAAVAFRIREFRPATMTGNATITLTGNEASGAAGVDTLEITCRDGALALAPVAITTPFGRLELGGALGLPGSAVPPPHGAAAGFAAVLTADIHDLGAYIPAGFAALHPEGRIEVRAAVRGDLARPETAFRGRVAGFGLDLPAPLPFLRELSADVVLADREIAVANLAAELGDRPVTGAARFGLDAPHTMSASLKGENILILNAADGSLRMRLDADLRLEGTAEAMKLSGDLGIPMFQYYGEFINSDITEGDRQVEDLAAIITGLGVDLPPAPEGGILIRGYRGLPELALDLTVKNRGDIRLQNSVLGVRLAGAGAIRGNLAEMAVSGNFRTMSGELRLFPGLFLPVNRFGLIIPPKAGVEPSINFESVLPIGNVRIFIRVTGPLAAPRLQLASEPPYPYEDLVALIIYGHIPGRGGAEGAMQAFILQAGKLFGGVAFDHMPRVEPGETFMSRFILGFESGDPRFETNEMLQSSGGSSGVYAEYMINDRLSLVTEQDRTGSMAGYLEYALRWAKHKPPKKPKPVAPTTAAAPAAAPAPAIPVSDFSGNAAYAAAELGAVIRPDLPLRGTSGWTQPAVSDAMFRLQHFYRENGYYFAAVEGTLRQEGKPLFTITEGPLVKMGRTIFRGNRAIKDAELQQTLFTDRPSLLVTPFSNRLYDA